MPAVVVLGLELPDAAADAGAAGLHGGDAALGFGGRGREDRDGDCGGEQDGSARAAQGGGGHGGSSGGRWWVLERPSPGSGSEPPSDFGPSTVAGRPEMSVRVRARSGACDHRGCCRVGRPGGSPWRRRASAGRGPPLPAARHLRAVVDRLHLLQIDSVSVLVRSHYLPLFSRLGPYDRAALDTLAWPATRRAALLRDVGARGLADAGRVRAAAALAQGARAQSRRHLGRPVAARPRAPELVAALLERVRAEGPLAASEVTAPRERTPGAMWDWSDEKRALEWLFVTGQLYVAAPAVLLRAAVRRPGARAAGGHPRRADAARGRGPGAAAPPCRRCARASRPLGDLADYFRMKRPDRPAGARRTRRGGGAAGGLRSRDGSSRRTCGPGWSSRAASRRGPC